MTSERVTDKMDITEKLGSYVKACDVTGNGKSTHCQDCRDAISAIERLRAALTICAADYVSPPCTVAEGWQYLEAEFMRRMNTAHNALRRTDA